MDTNKDFYCASGWFSPEQENARQDILEVLNELDVSFFSPKDESLVKPDDSDDIQKQVFKGNIKAITECKCVIASTVGKDLGTTFEVGVAYAVGVPIIYYCPGLTGNFNLMLAQSAIAVATNKDELAIHVEGFVKDSNYKVAYVGKIE